MPRPKGPSTPRTKTPQEAANYTHPEADLALRPEVGTQAQFRKHKPPQTYRYDSSLSPVLEFDGQNPAREQGEALIAEIADCGLRIADLAKQPASAKRDQQILNLKSEILNAAAKLKRLSGPFLNWTGKAERLSFDVPTLPLFVHERLSTRAIIETLTGHRRDQNLDFLSQLFADPRHSVSDQVLRAYEYREGWVNRMVLGDSLVVMNSLLRYESLGGQVQMIYMDPPYGVKFGSNFQPFVRKRDVSHGDDSDMTREPEMVQAYRDTWELGLHSYLTYLRDRLLLARELLAPTGSVFVQISDENLHHVRELMDEVFGAENFCVVICYRRLGTMIGAEMKSSAHYLVWYAKDKERQKFRKVFDEQVAGVGTGDHFTQLEHAETGETRPMTREEKANPKLLSREWKPYQLVSLQTHGINSSNKFPIELDGAKFLPGPNKAWRTTERGVQALIERKRLQKAGNTVRYKQFLVDFPFTEAGSIWEIAGRDPENYYVVQTPTNIIARCMLMTTDPGDLVLDPTCGSGTTAFVAEQQGRRWITCDTSRVPLALARQRLLTATFPWYELKDEAHGPAAGFTYQRRQNKKGEEVGGIVPHITLKSIANNEPPAEEVLVDRPEEKKSITRVCGPFVVEATIPTAHGADTEPETPGLQGETHGDFVARMLEVLRKSPVLRLDGNRTVTFRNIRPPAKTLVLSAEALVDKPSLANLADDASKQPSLERDSQPVAFLFGPENGAVSTRLVEEAAREAHGKHYSHLYVIGFGIEAKARETIENCDAVFNVPATYVQATPDLLMGDLLKNMRSSQIFSVCGLPDVKLSRAPAAKGEKKGEERWQVELQGLDVFDPITMEVTHRNGGDVPAWFLDTDYNGRVFHVTQAFFPRTGAWESLKKSLKGDYDESVWDHLAGTVSAPFAAGEHKEIAVKVIDDRGNELLVVKKLKEEKNNRTPMNAKHITEITVENFRGFDRLKLKDLQAVNLIVGQNNAGKTSLLEALTLIADPSSMQQMPGRLRANAGNVDKRYFRWLLKDAAEVESGSLIGTVGNTVNQLNFHRKVPKNVGVGMNLIFQCPMLNVATSANPSRLKVRVVSVQHRAPNDLVANFGNAVRKRAGEDMVHAILRAVDPRITRVRVDPVEEGNIIAVDIGLTESIPLSQAGQGIYRLVAVLSDLIGETPQVCIIDEIENGLHHTVLKQVWRGLAEISRKLGVQIFATTHSRECMEAAQAVFFDEDQAGERDFAVIQLMRVKDRIEGKVLNEARVEAALENEIELR